MLFLIQHDSFQTVCTVNQLLTKGALRGANLERANLEKANLTLTLMSRCRLLALEMIGQGLTIKELTDAVGSGITPRMVRHYHQLGLMPLPKRSPGNYRLYSDQDVQRLQRIVALKQQGFQLSHIHKLLAAEPEAEPATLMVQLQQQYQTIIRQITQLRQTATALERLLGRDLSCQATQAEVLARLKQLEVQTQTHLNQFEELWHGIDAEVHTHPESFQESL